MSSYFTEAVVLITSSEPDNSSFGTGFVIHQDEHVTYLLTCLHVVKDVGGLQMVKADDKPATVIASDEKEDVDLAVLSVEEWLDRPTLNLYVFGESGRPFVTAGFRGIYNGVRVDELLA